MKHINTISFFATIAVLFISGCQKNETEAVAGTAGKMQKEKPKVTFVELGSVNCIPCKQMQPVMKAVEEKYGDQIQVIFYDVWKSDQKHFAIDYHIQLIPTQVFLDENGKEFFRHEGFFPEEEIHTLLQSRGLKARE